MFIPLGRTPSILRSLQEFLSHTAEPQIRDVMVFFETLLLWQMRKLKMGRVFPQAHCQSGHQTSLLYISAHSMPHRSCMSRCWAEELLPYCRLFSQRNLISFITNPEVCEMIRKGWVSRVLPQQAPLECYLV